MGAHRRTDCEKLLRMANEDWAADDTGIRDLARKVLTPYEIDGDTYGVPGMVDIVELLVNEIIKLRKKK